MKLEKFETKADLHREFERIKSDVVGIEFESWTDWKWDEV